MLNIPTSRRSSGEIVVVSWISRPVSVPSNDDISFGEIIRIGADLSQFLDAFAANLIFAKTEIDDEGLRRSSHLQDDFPV